MSDLDISVDLKGIDRVKAMGDAFTSMTAAFEAAGRVTPNLLLLQKAIQGVGNSTGAVGAVEKEIKDLVAASQNMAKQMALGFDTMNKAVQAELKLLKLQVAQTVTEVSKPITRTGSGPLTDAVTKDAKSAVEASKRAAADLAKNARFLSATPAAQSRTAATVSTALGLGMSTADATKAYGSAALAATANSNGLSASLKALTLDGNNAHSMARGLASGFNLLWLTWGNLVPLFAGAAISNSFVQTVKIGSQVEHTLATIAVLGGNTTTEMRALSDEMIRLGNTGPVGPVAIADAMKVLSLAGLKANEILAVTQTVLNFSVSGTTDLKTAADALVSISTAFGMGSAGFARVGDVVSKAAAESKSSVESFAGAMKTASVISAQYGVSLVDTATGIATLSQLGIEGSAAGTALRNMYADLSGRSKEVAKTLQSQGIEMRTATGAFRPMLEVVADLNTKLQALDGISQKNLMQTLLSERGAKGIVEMLRLINTEAKNSGAGMTNALQEMRTAIEDSYGFAAISAAKLSQTTQKQFEAVKATMQTSMVQAFELMQPSLIVIADSLKQAFASPEFVSGLANLVTGIAQLGVVVIENAKFLTYMAAAYAAYRVTSALLIPIIAAKAAAKTAETIAIQANTTAQVANNVAQTGSLGVLGGLARVIPVVGTVIGLASAAWMAYEYYVASANNTAEKSAGIVHQNVVKSLKDQADKLAELNGLRRQGLTLSQAQQVLDDRKSKKTATAPFEDLTNNAIKAASAAQEKLNILKATPFIANGTDGKRQIAEQQRTVDALLANVTAHKRKELQVTAETETQIARIKAERRENDEREAAEAEARLNKSLKLGTDKFSRFKPEVASGSAARRDANADLAETINNIKRDEDAFIKAEQNKSKIAEAFNKSGKISDADYATQRLASIAAVEKERIASLTKQKEAAIAAMTNPAYRGSDLSGIRTKSKDLTAEIAAAGEEALARAVIVRNEADIEAYNFRTRASEKLIADSDKELASLSQQIEKRTLARDSIGKTKAEVDLLNAALLETKNIADEDLADSMFAAARSGAAGEYTEAYIQYANALKEVVRNRRTLKGLEESEAVQHTAAEEVAKAKKEQLELWKAVDDKAESVFMDIAKNGKSAFKSIAEELKNGLLKLLYEMTVKKWIVSLSGNMSGMGGGGGDIFSKLLGKGIDYLAESFFGASSAGISSGVAYAGTATGAAVSTTSLASIEAASVGVTALAEASAIAAPAAAATGASLSGMASSALAAVPVIGWVALGVAALWSIFGMGKVEIPTVLNNLDLFNQSLAGLPFQELAYTSDEAAQGLRDVLYGLENATPAMRRLAGETIQLTGDLMRAQGNVQGARDYDRNIASRGLSKAELELYDYNQALKDQIEAARAGAAASQAAAAAENQLASQRYDLAGKLNVLLNRQTQTQVDRAKELAGTTDAVVISMLNQIYVIEDLIAAQDAAYAKLERSVAAERKIVELRLKGATDLQDALKTAFTAVAPKLSYDAARSQLAMYAAIARAGGGLPKADDLKDILGSIADSSENSYETAEDYLREQLRASRDLNDLSQLAGEQVSIEQLNLDRLDAVLENAKAQLDALKGVDTSVTSVTAAVAAFEASMVALAVARANAPVFNVPAPSIVGGGGGGGYSGGTSASDAAATAGMDNDIVAAYKEYYGRIPDKAGHDAFIASKLVGDKLMQAILHASIANPEGADFQYAVSKGYNPYDPTARFLKSAKPVINDDLFVDGSFAVGTNYVPRDMTARIHAGEEITPRPFVDIQREAREETNMLLSKLLEANEKLADKLSEVEAKLLDGNKNTNKIADTLSGNQRVPLLVEMAQ